jgi:hypothetical protein
LDKIAAHAGASHLPELKQMRDEHQETVRTIAKAERELAVAAEERSAGRRGAAEGTLDAALTVEGPSSCSSGTGHWARI